MSRRSNSINGTSSSISSSSSRIIISSSISSSVVGVLEVLIENSISNKLKNNGEIYRKW